MCVGLMVSESGDSSRPKLTRRWPSLYMACGASNFNTDGRNVHPISCQVSGFVFRGLGTFCTGAHFFYFRFMKTIRFYREKSENGELCVFR